MEMESTSPGSEPPGSDHIVQRNAERRILYTYALHRDGYRTAVALVTVEFEREGGGTRLIVTEQGAYLDADEVPTHLEEGTRAGLERLAVELGETLTAGVLAEHADTSASTPGGR